MSIITIDSYTPVNLKYDKVNPRVHRFDYRKHHYAVYMYLDPFHEGHYKYEFECCNKKQKLETAYLPVYVGKLERPLQYRMNHHLNRFVTDKEDSQNQYKHRFFEQLEQQIDNNKGSGHPDTMMPKDMYDYKNHWIVIVKTFDNKDDLAEYERNLIKAIGCQFDHSGPLVNKKKGN